MAQSRFKFNSASNYAAGVAITADSGTLTTLTPVNTLPVASSSPSPQEGSAYVKNNVGTTPVVVVDTAPGTTTYYLDFFYYDNFQTGTSSGEIVACGQNWVDLGGSGYFGFYRQAIYVNTDGSLEIKGFFGYYNPDTNDGGSFEGSQGITSSSAVPQNAWCRIRVQINTTYIGPVQIFKGSNILGSTPDVTVAGSAATYPSSVGYLEYLIFFNSSSGTSRIAAIDDLYIDNVTWPVRSTGPTPYGPSIRR